MLEFGNYELRIWFDDGGTQRIVPASTITALHGASIRREARHPAPLEAPTLAERMRSVEAVAINEEFQHVIVVRASGVGEFWYLVADTFNFRKALGSEASLLFDQNMRLLLRKLTSIAPQAVADSFVTAMLENVPLPPPFDSYLEFFRTVSR